MGSTVPRLELLENLSLSRLMDSVKKSLSKVLSISEVFLWTDSQVTLAWITADSSGWYYCSTKGNPADLLTRTQNFSNFDLWWADPNFLREKKFNDRDVFSNFEGDFDKRFKQLCARF